MRATAIVALIISLIACGDDSDIVDAAARDSAGSDAQLDDGSAADGSAADGSAADGSSSDANAVDAARDVMLPDAVVALDADVPTELEDLPLHTWRAISRNTIRDVDPCPAMDDSCAWSAVEGLSGVVEDWTGGVYASGVGPLGSIIYWGGGHNGYYGNEIYAFDLATLAWQRLSDPTDGRTPGDPETFGLNEECRFWDGRPLAIHTYDTVFYEPGANRFWLGHIADAPSSPPGPPSDCASRFAAAFDFGTRDWVDSTTASPLRSVDAASAWDERRGLAWFVDTRATALISFEPETDRWQEHGSGDPMNIGIVAALDPDRDLLAIADFREGARLFAVDLEAGGDWFRVNTTGDTEIEEDSEAGFEFVPELGVFIAWSSGRSFYLLQPPEGDPRTELWVWTRVDGTGDEPDAPVNGPYSKFQYVPGIGVAFVASSVEGPVFAVRVVAR